MLYCECGNPLEEGQRKCDGCIAFDRLDKWHHFPALGDDAVYDLPEDEEETHYGIDRRSIWED